MIFFGHLGITLFLGFLLMLPLWPVLLGVLLPDLIDKVFFMAGLLPCGRSLAHNVFFGPLLAASLYALTRNKKIALAFLFGAYLHLAGDILDFIPFFYPLVSYDFACGPVSLVLTPYLVSMEVIGLSLLAALLFFRPKVVSLRERLNRGWKKLIRQNQKN